MEMRVGEGGLRRSGGRGDCGQDVFIQEKNIFPPPKKREREMQLMLKAVGTEWKSCCLGWEGGPPLLLVWYFVNFGPHAGFQQP